MWDENFFQCFVRWILKILNWDSKNSVKVVSVINNYWPDVLFVFQNRCDKNLREPDRFN